MSDIIWSNIKGIESKAYVCGHCSNPIASEKGFSGTNRRGVLTAYIYICHHCSKPSLFYEGEQTPGVLFGNQVQHIPDANVEKLYEEARGCFSINAFTSAVMCCRKLLMNLAVAEGAKEGQGFVNYIDYLDQNGFIPPKGRQWVDSIRKLGNEANHSIEFKSQEDAKLILTFTEMLLKFVYEMPGLLGGSSS